LCVGRGKGEWPLERQNAVKRGLLSSENIPRELDSLHMFLWTNGDLEVQTFVPKIELSG
jgi:hypothetical protein